MDEEVDWTNTVTNTPIINPTTGLARSWESEKRDPRFLPPRILNESDRKEREQMKKYKHRRRDATRMTTGMKTCLRLTVFIMMSSILH